MKIRKEIGKAFFVGVLIFIVVGVIEYLNGWEISSGKELVIRFVINQVYSVSLYMANAFFFYFIITRYKNEWFKIQHLAKGILGSIAISHNSHNPLLSVLSLRILIYIYIRSI